MKEINDFLGENRWVSPHISKTVYNNFVSGLTGIVSSVNGQMHEEDDIHCHSVGATSANSSYTLGNPTSTLSGGGGRYKDATFLAAVGEAIERYCIAYLPKTTKVATFSELSQDVSCLDPNQLSFFAEFQYIQPDFHYEKFDQTTQIAWTPTIDLRSGHTIYLPAQMVYMTSWAELEPCPTNITYATSNGLAAHLSVAEACLSGLFEIIERDTFMLTWYSKLSMPILPNDFSPQVEKFWKKHVLPTGLTAHLVNLSSINECPTVMAIVLNKNTSVAEFAIGAAAASSIESAAMKAIVEAFQTRTWVKTEQRAGNTLPPDCNWDENIIGFDDHVRLYADPRSSELREKISFLHSGALEDTDPYQWDIEGAGPIDKINNIINIDRLRGMDFYAVDCTSPDVLGEGVHVVKVISPQLLQLDAGYAARFLGHPRIRAGAFEQGLLSNKLTYEEINHLPHPFP